MISYNRYRYMKSQPHTSHQCSLNRTWLYILVMRDIRSYS